MEDTHSFFMLLFFFLILFYYLTLQSSGSMHDTGCLGLVHWDDPQGWYRDGEGGGFRMGNTCIPVAGSC